jgi:quercetin dioxygenase-like cupin family protein
LRAGWFEDMHPHEEVTHVLEGELQIRIGSAVHVLTPGDTLLVSAGTLARYTAPVFARMLFVYGPNPDGLPTPPPTEGPLPTAP